MKIYTKTGDDGTTSLWSGKRVAKNHPRLIAYGTIDELNASLGLLHAELSNEPEIQADIVFAQKLLFLLGSYFSCDKESLAASLPPFQIEWLEHFEKRIDNMQSELPELKNFILPGGSKAASYAHLSRCICRRAERLALSCEEGIMYKQESLQILNRFSDYLFVLSRYVNQKSQIADVIWQAQDLSKK